MSLLHRIQRANATGDVQAGPTPPVAPAGTAPAGPAPAPPTAPRSGLRPDQPDSRRPDQPLLDDEIISEVMVNGPKQVYVERKGRVLHTEVTFKNDEHVMRVIDRIISPLGRRCDESSPMVDARLPDGSRVHAIIPPLCLNGPAITIRKFSRNPLTTDDLITFGTLTPDMVAFLKACVESRLNVIVSGGTGS